MAQPETEAQRGAEQGARAIWDAMQELGRTSQQTTAQVGHLNRVEAHRTDFQSMPHQPLQAYMDEESIIRHIQPWQQILMFFARTQVAHEWTSPVYRFTTRQRRAWQALWRLAMADGRSEYHAQAGDGQPSHSPSHSQIEPPFTLSPI